MSEWINVKDKMPPTDGSVILCVSHEDGYQKVKTTEVYNYTVRFKKITHWMLLPNPPEETPH